MNEIKIFNNEEFGNVRTTEVNGELCFVAKDICEALGYIWKTNLIYNVPDEWKGTKPISTLKGMQEMSILTEQGLYFFLARSDKPKALPFQKWIAGDVVPSIRKHGAYMTPETIESALLNPDTIIKIATALKEEQQKRKALEVDCHNLEARAKETAPLVEVAKKLLDTSGLISLSAFGQILGMKNKIFKILREQRIIYYLDGNNVAYREYTPNYFRMLEKPYRRGNMDCISSRIYVTPKGQQWLLNKLITWGHIESVASALEAAQN